MSIMALQLTAETIGPAILADENVLFNTVQFDSRDISYNPATGEITLSSPGRYIVHWRVILQSTVPPAGALFVLVSDDGTTQIGNSSIKTGQVSGFGIFEVTDPDQPIILSLRNINNGTLYLAGTTPIQASLLITSDLLPIHLPLPRGLMF